jgi:alpha-ketoglutarate-dependent taurine dioxygenase
LAWRAMSVVFLNNRALFHASSLWYRTL